MNSAQIHSPPPDVHAWAHRRRFDPIQVDCTTAVVLKILDRKCKVSPVEQEASLAIYDSVRDRPGEHFGAEVHALIAQARGSVDAELSRPLRKRAPPARGDAGAGRRGLPTSPPCSMTPLLHVS